MKKLSLVVVLFLLFFSATYGQTVPQGMKYQAVARNLAGAVIANQEIALKVSLLTKGDAAAIYYTEVHTVTTNQLGLFNLVIGDGKVENGSFSSIPWSTDDVWMQIAIKEKGKSDFAMISSSKLLAVPYAFHAGTASELIGNSRGLQMTTATSPTTTTTGTSAPGGAWLLGGNLNSSPGASFNLGSDFLGTADYKDLVFKTNKTERLRIYADGNIALRRTLSIGANLNVDSSVNLNIKEGSTVSNGSFTVGTATRRSPTFLFGTLTVDKDQATKLGGTLDVDKETQLNSSLTVAGITNLNSNLNVNNASPTKLTGTLQVDGVTNLNNDVNVNNVKPTVLTGTLRVDKDATLNDHFLVTSSYQSTSTTTGAAVITGGLGLGGNFNVGGDAAFGGKTSFAGAVRISDKTPSTDTGTGALIVSGGAGIGMQLNVGGATNLSSTLTVSGKVNFNDSTQSTSTTTGALVTPGGVGIGKNLNVGGTLTAAGATTLNSTLAANGQVTIRANPSGGENDYNAYPLKVEGAKEGIAIKINESRSNANNFISFWDVNGMQGRVEGQTLAELHDDADYKNELASRAYDVTSAGIDLLFATTDLASAISDQISAAASVNACAGLGIVACPPIASLIAGSAVNLGLAIAQEVVVIVDVVFASVNLAKFIESQDAQVGVTYQSGAGDYAECLLREDANEKIFPGDIVGVRGGKISKNTEGAEKLMVISHKPIVLGNVPPQGTEHLYEKVAFMGQIPTKVLGKVNLGDYIIANGVNQGVGVAVAPDKIEAKDIKNIVGKAWSTASQGFQFSMVNVAVGLNVNDNQKLIDEQSKQIFDLKSEISQITSQLEKLVPGFKGGSNTNALTSNATSNNAIVQQNAPQGQFISNDGEPRGNPNITYKELTREELLEGFELAQKISKENGVDVDKNEFWKKYKTDASYRELMVGKVLTKYKAALRNQKEVDEKLYKQGR